MENLRRRKQLIMVNNEQQAKFYCNKFNFNHFKIFKDLPWSCYLRRFEAATLQIRSCTGEKQELCIRIPISFLRNRNERCV